MRYLIFLLFSLAIGVSSSMAQNTIQSLPRGSAMNLHDQTFFEIEDYSLPPSQAGKSMSWATILMSLDVRYIQGLGTPTLDSNFVLTIPITGKTDLTVDLSPLRQGLSGGGTGAESFADLTGQLADDDFPNDIISQRMLSPTIVQILNRIPQNPLPLIPSSSGQWVLDTTGSSAEWATAPSGGGGGTSYDDTELRGRVTQNETDITDLRGRVTTLENEPDHVDTNTHNNDFRAVADSNARGDLTEDDVTVGGLVLESSRGGFLTPYLESGSLAYRPFLFGRPHFISALPVPVLEGDFAVVGDTVYLAKQTDLATTSSTNFGTSDWIDLTKDNDTIYDDTDLKGRVTDLETEVSQLHVLGSYIDSIRSFHNRWSESHTSTSRIDTSQGYSNFFDYRSGSSNYLSSGITFDDSQDAIVLPTNSLIRVVSAEWTSLDNHETIAFRNSSGQDVPFVRLEGGVLQYNSSGSRSGITWVNAGIPPLGTQVRPNIGDTLILQVRPSGSGIRVVPVIKLTQGTTTANDDVFQELNDFEISNADPDLTRWEFRGVTNYKGFDPSQSLSHDQLEDLLRDHIDQMWAFGTARLVQTDTEVDQYGPKINFQNNIQVEGTELPDYIRSVAGSGTDTPSGGVTSEQVSSAIESAVEDYALSGSPNAKIDDNRLNRPLTEVYQHILDQWTYTSSDNIDVTFTSFSVPYSNSTGVIRQIHLNNETVTFDGTQGSPTHIQFIEGSTTLEYPLTLSSGNVYSMGESQDGNFPSDDIGLSNEYEVKIRTATGFLVLSSLAVASSHVDISNAIGLPSLTKENLRTILESGSSSTGLAYSSLRGTPTVPTRWINDVTLSGSTFTFDVIGGSDRVLTVPDNDTLSGLSCSTGEIAKYSGSSWSCARDEIGMDKDVLGSLNCSTNQIAQYNGTAWACVDTPSGGGGGGSTTTIHYDELTINSDNQSLTVPSGRTLGDYFEIQLLLGYSPRVVGSVTTIRSAFTVPLRALISSISASGYGVPAESRGAGAYQLESTPSAVTATSTTISFTLRDLDDASADSFVIVEAVGIRIATSTTTQTDVSRLYQGWGQENSFTLSNLTEVTNINEFFRAQNKTEGRDYFYIVFEGDVTLTSIYVRSGDSISFYNRSTTTIGGETYTVYRTAETQTDVLNGTPIRPVISGGN